MSRRYPPLITQAGQHVADATSLLAPPPRPTSRMLQTVDGAVRGRTVEFEVDTDFLENESKLKFHVTGPSRTEVHATPRPGQRAHLVTFVPQDEGIYSLSVMYNDVEVDGSPFHISVADDPSYTPPTGDASKCVAKGQGIRSAVENKVAQFEVETIKAGFGRLTVKMTGPGKVKIDPFPPEELLKCANAKDIGGAPSKFEYTAPEAGDYKLYICWAERHIPGSPFKVVVRRDQNKQVEDKVEKCLEAAKSVVVPPCPGLSSGKAKQWKSFTVDTRQAGDGAVAVSVQGPTRCDVELCKQSAVGSSVPSHGTIATNSQSGVIDVKYLPDSAGKFVFQVTFNDIQVPGSPFTVMVQD